jgi:pyruvate dehydrogenase E2 component (dihydrolipoamide acetyltransferase)
MADEIKLQALKEGVDTVEVNAVKVAPGDVVAKDQPLLEVQADKAALEVTSPSAGKVVKILVKAGDEIKVGQPYLVLDSTNGEAPAAPPKSPDTAQAEKARAEAPSPPKAQKPAPPRAPERQATPPPAPVAAHAAGNDKLPAASPAIRRLAREFGIDLRHVRGSGRLGRIVEDDVKSYVKQLAAGGPPVVSGPAPAAPPLPKFEDWGPVERQPLSPVRKATARQVSVAWAQIPHVTQHDIADITDLEAFRKSQGERSGDHSPARGPKLTVTAFAIKAVAIALKEFPTFNASLDLASNQLVLKRHYHVGIAVDTENGLLVPVLRDVDKKSVAEIAAEMAAAAERARQRKLDGSELKGGTFTVTNLGGIGGTAFTPIVNWPEVAILGLSRSRLEPVVRNGAIVPRLMLPLSLSYDHRVIDGAAAARFTRRLAEMLENPLLMLLQA